MKYYGRLSVAALLAIAPLYGFAQEKVVPIKYGDMDQWIIRKVHESGVIGGNTKLLYEIGPTKEIDGNKPYKNMGGSPWGTSNVMAKVVGIVKTNNSVYRDKRDNGYCARLETHIESVKVLGMVNITVLAAGSIYLGDMLEPITGTKNAEKNMNWGVPFTQRPKAVRYDYKVKMSGEKDRIRLTGFSKKGQVAGQDCAITVFFLQKRMEDAEGNITAKRVGTMVVKYDKDSDGWVNGALKKLAESMKQYFSKDVILGRNGGDEFSIFMPDCTEMEVKPFLKKFTEETRNFYCKGEAHTFTISLGFAEYPVLADDRSKLMRCADMALYEVKMRGKNGCMAYREGEQVKSRAKLGFAVKDIIDNMPGAFIVYRADKENDEILLANSELLRLTGCKNMDELLAYTGKSFFNLIRPDEQESCQKSIWSQINGGHSNDYIFFHMRKADGTYISVLDHGRIVDSVHNGRVFYVMIMDLKSLQMHYGDCLELVEK